MKKMLKCYMYCFTFVKMINMDFFYEYSDFITIKKNKFNLKKKEYTNI